MTIWIEKEQKKNERMNIFWLKRTRFFGFLRRLKCRFVSLFFFKNIFFQHNFEKNDKQTNGKFIVWSENEFW